LQKHPNHLALIPKVPLTEKEINDLEAYATLVCVVNKRPYQYFMFLGWIAKLKSWGLLNWGEKGDKKVYCFELVNHAVRLLSRCAVDGLVSIYDIYDYKDYRHD